MTKKLRIFPLNSEVAIYTRNCFHWSNPGCHDDDFSLHHQFCNLFFPISCSTYPTLALNLTTLTLRSWRMACPTVLHRMEIHCCMRLLTLLGNKQLPQVRNWSIYHSITASNGALASFPDLREEGLVKFSRFLQLHVTFSQEF